MEPYRDETAKPARDLTLLERIERHAESTEKAHAIIRHQQREIDSLWRLIEQVLGPQPREGGPRPAEPVERW